MAIFMPPLPFFPAAGPTRPAGSPRLTPAWAQPLGLGALLALAACHPREGLEDVRQRLVFREDFEHLDGWVPDPAASLSTEHAHSGRYSVKVSKAQPYSITYRLTLGQVFAQRPRRLHLSAWVWVPAAEEAAQLVLSISAPAPANTPLLLWKELFLNDEWPSDRWAHVSRDFDIPASGTSSQSQLLVYLWHGGAHNPVFTDDWELTELR